MKYLPVPFIERDLAVRTTTEEETTTDVLCRFLNFITHFVNRWIVFNKNTRVYNKQYFFFIKAFAVQKRNEDLSKENKGK